MRIHPSSRTRSSRSLAAALVLAFTAGLAAAKPATYTIVSKISRASFTLEHQGFIHLVGTARVAPGSFVFDPDDWSRSSIQVELPTASIDMGDAVWNGALRGDTEWTKLWAVPAIAFRSTAFERTDATHGVLKGTLAMAGVTRPVALQVRFNKLGRNEVSEYPSVGFSATTTIQRSKWGVDAYSDLVGDDIEVTVQLEAAVGPDPDAGHDLRAPGVAR